jgi:hypothetical protein
LRLSDDIGYFFEDTTGAQIAAWPRGSGAFEHDFPATRYTIEISVWPPAVHSPAEAGAVIATWPSARSRTR